MTILVTLPGLPPTGHSLSCTGPHNWAQFPLPGETLKSQVEGRDPSPGPADSTHASTVPGGGWPPLFQGLTADPIQLLVKQHPGPFWQRCPQGITHPACIGAWGYPSPMLGIQFLLLLDFITFLSGCSSNCKAPSEEQLFPPAYQLHLSLLSS